MEVNLNPFLPGESRLPSWFGLWSPSHSKSFLACAQCCSGTEQIASTHSSSLTSTIPSFNARTLNDRIFEHKHIPFGQQRPATTASGQANKIHLICHQTKLRTTTQPFAANVEIKFELIQTGNRQVKNKKPSKMRKPNVLVVFGEVSNFCELVTFLLWLNKMKLEVEIDWRTSLPSRRLQPSRWQAIVDVVYANRNVPTDSLQKGLGQGQAMNPNKFVGLSSSSSINQVWVRARANSILRAFRSRSLAELVSNMHILNWNIIQITLFWGGCMDGWMIGELFDGKFANSLHTRSLSLSLEEAHPLT